MNGQFETLADYIIRVVTFYGKHFIDKNIKPLKQRDWTPDYITDAVNRTLTEVFGNVADRFISLIVRMLTVMLENENVLQYFREPSSVNIELTDQSLYMLDFIECAQLVRYCDESKLQTIMTPSTYDYTLNVRSYLEEFKDAGDRLMDDLKVRYGDTINTFPLCTVSYDFDTCKRSRKFVNRLLRNRIVNMNRVTPDPRDIIVYSLDSVSYEIQSYEEVDSIVDIIRVAQE